MRTVAREQPHIVVELSMRRDLAEPLAALVRCGWSRSAAARLIEADGRLVAVSDAPGDR